MTTEKTQNAGVATDSAPAAGSVFSLECCPHCGGETGFSYRLYMKCHQFRSWGDAIGRKGKEAGSWTTCVDIDSRHGAYRCDDCGKVIKSNVLMRRGAQKLN